MAARPIPEGYHSVSPALAIDGAADAIDFYKQAFGATERSRMAGPEGKVAHAELEIGDSVVMLSDPFPQSTVKAPTELGGTTVGLFVYVEDVDAVFRQAVDAGATVTMELEDMFWGDRFGTLTDPYGHSWSLATHVEDVPPEEMEERAKQAMAAMGSS
ncbi:MAG: VOC family protein [Actinomycetota bacterium]|nr:VOC family protein [Actinomycetota bacterium]